MPKINKVYPPFFNGVSEQSPELILDNQCKEMVNCVPDVVQGLYKRPPVTHVTTQTFTSSPQMETANVFHTYDRGEDTEEYIFYETPSGTDPIEIYSKDGTKMTLAYNPATETEVKSYLATGNLKGLTVQDRTWILSKDAEVDIDYSNTYPLNEGYTRIAYYWLKTGSGDRYNPFNYAVYLNGITYAVNPTKPSLKNYTPAKGAEDTDWAAADLAAKINNASGNVQIGEAFLFENQVVNTRSFIGKGKLLASPAITINTKPPAVYPHYTETISVVVSNVVYDTNTGYVSYTITNNSYWTDGSGNTYPLSLVYSRTINYVYPIVFKCEVSGSILKIYREDGGDFSFSSWDSWGNQASEGWKGEVNKITDLPQEMPFAGAFVRITGDTETDLNDYYVRWNGSAWEECLDPAANRGRLINMPIKADRTALVGGVATFTLDLVDWSEPRVGNTNNNPDPSFAPNEAGVKFTITDMFFYKNRLGIASSDSVVLSETANYTNFYSTTVLDVVATDVIDVTVAATQAGKIHYVKPFNNSLYIFTKYSQFELVGENGFTPATVSLNNVTNYPMAVEVEPIVVNDKLYFISTTNQQQQLREYIKTENLNVKGIDLNVSTPTYLNQPITKLVVDGVLGYVLCCTATNTVFVHSFKEDGTEKIQSAWSKWKFLEGLSGSFEYFSIASNVLIFVKTLNDYRYHTLQLDLPSADACYDASNDGISQTEVQYPYESSITLPTFYPQLSRVRTPLNKVLLKKLVISGEGAFDVDIYRKDYNYTYSRQFAYSVKDKDVHIQSKVNDVELTVKDATANNFKIESFVLEGLFRSTSREIN